MSFWEKIKGESEYISDELTESDLSKTKKYALRLKQLLNDTKNYSFGLHEIGMHGTIDFGEKTLVESFFESGIKTARDEQGGVVQVVAMLGNNNVEEKIDITSERLHYMTEIEGRQGFCLVAIPEYMEQRDGKKYSLGKFPDDLNHTARDDLKPEDYPISVLFNNVGFLPKEFIMGIMYKDELGKSCLQCNPNYISKLTLDEQSSLLDQYFKMGLPKVEYEEEKIYKITANQIGRKGIEPGINVKDNVQKVVSDEIKEMGNSKEYLGRRNF